MVRRYEPSDFPEISRWAKHYGGSYDEKYFPKVGFIVEGIAAYFLYETNSKICFLENMISNPDSKKEDRDFALKEIISKILDHAKDNGFEVAYACTNIPAVILRAATHGAKIDPHYVLIQKDLRDLSPLKGQS